MGVWVVGMSAMIKSASSVEEIMASGSSGVLKKCDLKKERPQEHLFRPGHGAQGRSARGRTALGIRVSDAPDRHSPQHRRYRPSFAAARFLPYGGHARSARCAPWF